MAKAERLNEELLKMKQDVRKQRDLHKNLRENPKWFESFDHCNKLMKDTLGESETQSKQFLDSFGMQMNEVETTLRVLMQFKEASMKRATEALDNIRDMELTIKEPYLKNKDKPYYIHSIIIHDGLAENGHYYSYVYDRVKKVWWKMNDHKVSQETEETVLKEAYGGEGYKSACYLIFISKAMGDRIDQRSTQ